MTYLLLVPIVVFLLLSGFFSGTETGAYRVNPVRLQLLSNQGHRGSVRLRKLLEDREGILSVTLLGTNLANYLTTILTAMFLARLATDWSDQELELYTTLILTPIVLTIGEIVPKNWFRQQANALMTRARTTRTSRYTRRDNMVVAVFASAVTNSSHTARPTMPYPDCKSTTMPRALRTVRQMVTPLSRSNRLRPARTAPKTPNVRLTPKLTPVAMMANRAGCIISDGTPMMEGPTPAKIRLAAQTARPSQTRSQKAAETTRLDSSCSP